MQRVAVDDCIRPAVERIPRQWVANVGHMDTYLVGAPGARVAGSQTVAVADSQHGIFRQAVLAVLPHAAANNGIPAAGNGRFHPAGPQGQRALHNGKVAFMGAGSQQRRGKGVLRAEHQTACVFINAIDRTKNAGSALRLQIVQPAVGQCSIRIVQRGVHGNARGLIQYGGKFILIGNGKRNRLWRDGGFLLRRQCKVDALAGVNRLIGAHRPAVGKKAVTIVFDGLDKPRCDALRAQEKPQPAAILFRRHGISQNGHSAALLKAHM